MTPLTKIRLAQPTLACQCCTFRVPDILQNSRPGLASFTSEEKEREMRLTGVECERAMPGRTASLLFATALWFEISPTKRVPEPEFFEGPSKRSLRPDRVRKENSNEETWGHAGSYFY